MKTCVISLPDEAATLGLGAQLQKAAAEGGFTRPQIAIEINDRRVATGTRQLSAQT
jgi:hypothetical protein